MTVGANRREIQSAKTSSLSLCVCFTLFLTHKADAASLHLDKCELIQAIGNKQQQKRGKEKNAQTEGGRCKSESESKRGSAKTEL